MIKPTQMWKSKDNTHVYILAVESDIVTFRVRNVVARAHLDTVKSNLRTLLLKPILNGQRRVYRKCKTCGRVYADCFTTFGLDNPVTWLPCNHRGGTLLDLTVEVSLMEALTYWDENGR